MKPFEKDLAEVAALKTHEQVAACFEAQLSGKQPPELDPRNPDRYVATIVQAGLGLPVRDFYLNTNPKFVAIRAKYRDHNERMLTLAHVPNATACAKDVLQLEIGIAQR